MNPNGIRIESHEFVVVSIGSHEFAVVGIESPKFTWLFLLSCKSSGVFTGSHEFEIIHLRFVSSPRMRSPMDGCATTSELCLQIF